MKTCTECGRPALAGARCMRCEIVAILTADAAFTARAFTPRLRTVHITSGQGWSFTAAGYCPECVRFVGIGGRCEECGVDAAGALILDEGAA